MVFFEQSGMTTPFTIPQFQFVQTVGQQSQDNINAAFPLSSGPTCPSDGAESELWFGTRSIWRRQQERFRLLAAMELYRAEDILEWTGTLRSDT
jgi:hypothetical protein